MRDDLILYLGESLAEEWRGCACASELEEALNLIQTDRLSGLARIDLLARNGSRLSMMYLGNIYLNGEYGIREDKDLGEIWLRRSSDAGSVEAKYGLAWHLLRSNRIEESIKRYEELSCAGYSPAQFSLGMQYYKGVNIEKNIDKALLYFKLAADSGHFYAKNQVCRVMMRENMGLISKIKGFFMKIGLFIPFIRFAIKNPKSDRIRVD
jgi:TPR repeat protein